MRPISRCVVAAALAMSACTVHDSTPPALTGPSTSAVSVAATATPDILTMGPFSSASGQSSFVSAAVRDAAGNPVSGRTVHFESTFDAGTGTQFLPGCGLSTTAAVTNTAGVATATFTAPGYPPTGFCSGMTTPTIATVTVTPDGTDFQATQFVHANVKIVLNRPNQ